MNTKSKVVLGILGAAAAGVVIGLLIAPEKGSEMRKKLKKKASGWADEFSHLFVKGKEAAEDGIEELKEKGRHAKNTAEEKINKMKETLG
ncbi:MAG: YtxH domain-containing protein [Chitinophagaceae bacterium]|nr:YtxH domain-containing protein [Chitinophagaceae bacterium]